MEEMRQSPKRDSKGHNWEPQTPMMFQKGQSDLVRKISIPAAHPDIRVYEVA